ncbi:MAG: clostripain-related cysteine peptidase [Eubacteriales bacterium]
MKRDNSTGRKKNVASGTASVHKRGSGLGSSKPMGNKTGYADRKPSSNSSSSNSSGGYTSSSSGGGYTRSGGSFSLKRIITFAIIAIIAYFVLKSCMGIDLLDSIEGMDTGDNSLYGDTYTSSNSSQSNDYVPSNSSLDYSVSNDARDKYTKIVGGGKDEFTIMVYMCGSDLESRSGMATADLNEMLHSDISKNINLVVETGGARTWKNSTISSSTNQRYQVTADGLKTLDDNVGKKNMTDPDTLKDFIEYCEKNFEADRYALILWDHGGGSNQGYGHDEFYGSTTMTLDEIHEALGEAGVKFDFVGFDACLMATYETAIMMNNHADYLIASEETEPGIGWYYTDWLNDLSADTSMPTVEIGKSIIDSFIEKCYQASPYDKTTLSLIDLAELAGTAPEAFNAFASSTGELINSDEYKIVADARGNSREYGAPNQLNQIDLIHLAQNIGTDEAAELVDVLENCIKYNRTSSTISNSNGLSIYFPYTTLSSMGSMINTYEKIGMDAAYTDCIRGFASLEVGGQAISSGSSSPFGSLLGSFMGSSGGGSDLVGDLLTSFLGSGDLSDMLGGSDTSWVDMDSILSNKDFYQDNYLASDALELTEKDGIYVLSMTDDEWDLIQNVQLNVFFDDGEGYIDLGMDNVHTFDDDGDLIIDFDGTWLTLDGHVVAYYFIDEKYEGDDYLITGRVPAMLNGELVDIILVFDSKKDSGEVLGARLVYSDGSIAKGVIPIEDGDVIDFICDYYTYDEEFNDSYLLGDQMIVSGEIQVRDMEIEQSSYLVTYMLTDIYNNSYWTPSVASE